MCNLKFKEIQISTQNVGVRVVTVFAGGRRLVVGRAGIDAVQRSLTRNERHSRTIRQSIVTDRVETA